MEDSALKQKLNSDEQALNILKRELLNLQKECNYYQKLFDLYGSSNEKISSITGTNFTDMMKLSMENRRLKLELEDLRKENNDMACDLKVLRQKQCKDSESNSSTSNKITLDSCEKSDLINELEQLHLKLENLKSDLLVLNDEKEELVQERDLYRQKTQRLNHELQIALNGGVKDICDVDSLIMENRNLQVKLNNLENEKEFLDQVLSKCMELLNTRKARCSLRIGANNGSSEMNVTYKQLYQLLDAKNSNTLTVPKLRCLSIALLDLLRDESIALLHQKKMNKLLANRLVELDHLLKEKSPLKNSSPSHILLKGYAESSVAEVKERYADIIENLPSDIQNLFQEAMESVMHKEHP